LNVVRESATFYRPARFFSFTQSETWNGSNGKKCDIKEPTEIGKSLPMSPPVSRFAPRLRLFTVQHDFFPSRNQRLGTAATAKNAEPADTGSV
jgi:hypothetical protein